MALNIESVTGSPVKEQAEPTIPDEVLSIPAFGALLRGTPPAVYAPKDVRTPEVEIIERNIEPLIQSGFGIYKTLDGKGSVLFNTQYIDENQLKVADQKGKLDVLAPPLTEALDFFNSKIPQDGAAPAPAPVAPAPAPSDEAAIKARSLNTALGAPSSGPAPGQGRILNSILKPVV